MRPWKFESAYISNAAFDGAGAAAKTVAPIHAATTPPPPKKNYFPINGHG